ncbi:RagB/SusD family nutrient uptake outer membrane protein [Adhaeribacter arboris]|uniref:RagB/SusD family nutrient uptake outer membrane protein n=1 Tax=Adhaeribacter arboris TaxID=2072846 RepID=A0A2T2YL16_9BACT|nr:RagB/SusD family nutrient uptake outer membrane protein [Adhaeribacter arboris]PSR56179.1 RagB/SusD family nutrient uptake outer membrane protein [Adhaeribacter arboris]
MRKIYVSACLLGALLLSNCHDDLDKVNPNSLTSESYFKTANELELAVNSIYATAHSNLLVAREWFFTHSLRSGDFATGGAQLEAPRAQILNGNTTPDNGVSGSVWNGFYTVIHRANTVILNGPLASGDATKKDLMVAEARFLRAWAYYELVNFFGAVPLYTEPVTAVDAFQARTKPEDIYKVVLEDLKAAQAGLPPTRSGGDLGRATSGAATFLLGKSYMQQGDYTTAKTELEKLVGKYTLTAKYNDNFREETEYNSESIWEIGFQGRSDNGYNWGSGDGPNEAQSSVRNQEINPISWRNLIPSDKLLNEYETPENGAAKRDPRLDYTVFFPGDKFNNDTKVLTEALQGGAGTSTLNGQPIKVSWEKYTNLYKTDSGFNPAGINTRVMRYAEALLLLAECENELGNQTAAVSYLNQLRDRADVMMPHYPTAKFPVGSKGEVFAAIVHESAVERGGEEGRDFDVLRWIKASKITPPFTTYSFNPNRDFVLPVPQDEINRNPQLGAAGISAQNPNY